MRVFAVAWSLFIQAGVAIVQLVTALVKRKMELPEDDIPTEPDETDLDERTHRRHGRASSPSARTRR